MARAGVLAAPVLFCIALPSSARAQEITEYVVGAGDSCGAIAVRLWGDRRHVRQIHAHNALGPSPHRLEAGRVLRVPRTAPRLPPESGADARLSWLRNRVETYTPDRSAARLNQDLRRGNKVSTQSESSAAVTFVDETTLKLDADTLVVIVGGTSRSAHRTDAAQTTLVTGRLRAFLAQMSGAAESTVATESGEVRLGRGEAQVEVDETSATRLAVYRGRSKIRARRRTVDVPEGFGSKAERGKAPSPPRPLPAPPAWTAPPPRVVLLAHTDGHAGADLRAEYGPGGADPAAASWHVQLARDWGFDDIVADTRVPIGVLRLEARGLGAGTYFARVSAIDADRFEGPFGTVAEMVVAIGRIRGRHVEVTPSAGISCALDGAPLGPSTELPEIDRSIDHVLRCGPSAGGEGSVDVLLPAVRAARPPAAPPEVRMRLGVDRLADGQGVLEVIVNDPAGIPLEGARVSARAAGTEFAAFRETEAVGTYRSSLRWPSEEETLHVEVAVRSGAGGGAHAEEDFELVPPEVESSVQLGLLASVVGGVESDRLGGAARGELRFRLPLGGPSLLIGPRAGIEAAAQPSDLGRRLTTISLASDLRLDRTVFPFVAYAGVEPLLLAHGDFETRLAVAWHAGLEGRALGPGRPFLELGVRHATQRRASTPAWLLASVGYRFDLEE